MSLSMMGYSGPHHKLWAERCVDYVDQDTPSCGTWYSWTGGHYSAQQRFVRSQFVTPINQPINQLYFLSLGLTGESTVNDNGKL